MSPASHIYQELQASAPTLLRCGQGMPFQVPENYFEQLPMQVLSRIPTTEKSRFGDVPAGYFEGLPQQILNRIKLQDEEHASTLSEDPTLSPLLASLRNHMPFHVPDHYFGALTTSERMVAGKQMPFAVPANYFEQLPTQLLQRVAEVPQTARVVSFQPRTRTRWIQAVAAVFLFALAGIGVYRYTQQATINSGTAIVQPSKALDEAILAGTQMTDADFEQQLKELNPVDVFSYLEKNTTEADMTGLTAHVDEQKLPDGDQLLLDDQALDQFIQELESSVLQP